MDGLYRNWTKARGCYRLYRREGVRTENGERSRVEVDSHESREGIGDSRVRDAISRENQVV